MKIVDCKICGSECIPIMVGNEMQSISCVKCQLHMMKIAGLHGDFESDEALIRRWNGSIGDIPYFKIVMESIGEHMTATVVMNGKVQARGVPVITNEWYESQYGELK